MVNLKQFPPEILSVVTSYVTAFDLCHLIWCGDNRLSRLLLSGGVEEFYMIIDEKMPKNGVVRWPTLVSRFCGLRSLVISIDPPFSHAQGPVSHIRLDQLPSSLRQIKFRFKQAETCFFRTPPRLDVVYPHQLSGMKYVELGDYSGSDQDFSDGEEQTDFEGVVQPAPVLKKLVLEKLAHLPKESPSIIIDNQHNHPAHIWTSDGIFNFQQQLPNLLHLSLQGYSCIQPHQLAQFTPETLISLKLSSMQSYTNGKSTGNTILSYHESYNLVSNIQDWPTAFYPLSSQLSSLRFNTFPTVFDFGQNVVELELATIQWDQTSRFASLLPHQLKTLKLHGVILPSTSDTHPVSSEAMKPLNMQMRWPASLSHVEVLCKGPLEGSIDFVSTLPRTLKSLSFQVVPNQDIRTRSLFEALPSSLETLDLGRCRSSYCVGPDLLPLLPLKITALKVPLKDADCCLLPPGLLSLTSRISQTTPDPGQTLASGLPRTLQELLIGSVSTFKVSSTFSEHLPKGLRRLTLSEVFVKSSFFDHLPPQLQGLRILDPEVCYSPLSISKLPPTLLELDAPSAFFSAEGAIRLLPRGLLKYRMSILYSVPCDEAKQLPPSLPIPSCNFTTYELETLLGRNRQSV